jgi:SRSO17 transposase
LERGPVRAWLVDDTGLPRKGRLSVGVARQYRGQVGKRENCQVAVTLSIADEAASLPIAYRLYLPEGWANDPARRAMAGVPEEVVFRTKPEIALEQIGRAMADGVPPGVVVTDAGYGNDTGFRDGVTALAASPPWRRHRPGGVTALGLPYVAAVQGTTGLWAAGTGPLPAAPRPGRGRPPKRLRRDADHQPLPAEELALGLPADAWRSVTWREGTAGELASRFAAVRVRPAHGDTARTEPRPEEWFLVEWPEGETEPTKYWLSTLPETATLEELVATAKLRWRIERGFEELKQELGLGHVEGRGWRGAGAALARRWRGFHHHAALCVAAYGFLVAERCRFSPPGWRPRLAAPERPADYRPRGSSRAPRAAQPGVDRHLAPPPRGRADAPLAAMSLLPASLRTPACAQQLMTL